MLPALGLLGLALNPWDGARAAEGELLVSRTVFQGTEARAPRELPSDREVQVREERWRVSGVLRLRVESTDPETALVMRFRNTDEKTDALSLTLILVSREGEAFGLASGLHLGGQTPVVLIQNTGFLETGDAFRGTAYNMGVPLVSLIGYRGLKTMQPGAQRVDTAATFFEPTLKAWNIPYGSIYTEADLGQIDWAFATAKETGRPTAVILAEETT